MMEAANVTMNVRTLGEIEAELSLLRKALEEIAKYDSGNGCCPYGCDAPTIAIVALAQKGDGALPDGSWILAPAVDALIAHEQSEGK